MASPLLSLPREVRDMISEIVIMNNDQPFRLHYKHLARTPATTAGLSTTCRQLHAEYGYLLRRAAFSPGTRTTIPTYDFDFTRLTSFVQTLRAHEIAAANRNANFVVNLVILDPASLAKTHPGLLEWAIVCETRGVKMEYTVHWTSIDPQALREMQTIIGRLREGRKILDVLGRRNVKSWTWTGYESSLVKAALDYA
ncbi:hypothetical protein Slin15195_G033930 [Septoria linicola]|uniref:Uncharacterized protein n=1 Tax=Septoria linicola TaxID=215465 RepID=A0A9Q9AIM0_9PEZI|nr:hypothetical protein Slin15195_G033930 [Septoria linicola]